MMERINMEEDSRRKRYEPERQSRGRGEDRNSGQICFKGFGPEASSNAPYLIVAGCTPETRRLDPNIDMKGARNVWRYIRQEWKLPEPKVILSVTGGANRFAMKERHLKSFKLGLMKAATSADAWIITGGTQAGVMKFVGEAVREYMLENGSYEQQLVIIGIASFGAVANSGIFKTHQSDDPCEYDKNAAIDKKTREKSRAVLLDPHHTHFILVDDGKKDKFGGEIEFRAAFEQYNNKVASDNESPTENVPVVLLVLEGGANTLKTASGAIENDTPVIVIDGSGRAADFVAFANKICNDERIRAGERNQMLKVEAMKLLKPPDTSTADKTDYDECVEQVLKLVDVQKKHLLTIFHPDANDEQSAHDIDQAILSALLRANTKGPDGKDVDRSETWRRCIDLAITWNRCDVAKEEIFSDDNRKHWKAFNMDESMATALIQNKAEFVNLFMEHGVDLKTFLTYERLQSLYTTILDDPDDDTSASILNNLINEAKVSLVQNLL